MRLLEDRKPDTGNRHVYWCRAVWVGVSEVWQVEKKEMKRIIMHWTAGPYQVTSLDKEHYHFIIDGDGVTHKGKWPVSANERIVKGQYAAHTLGCNTGSIGVSVACMGGNGVSMNHFGRFPLKELQVEALCKLVAQLSIEYGIPVDQTHVLTHAEVQPVLGIKQRGKWDITILPYKSAIQGHAIVGDHLRSKIIEARKQIKRGDPLPTSTPKPVVLASAPQPKQSWYQKFAALFSNKEKV